MIDSPQNTIRRSPPCLMSILPYLNALLNTLRPPSEDKFKLYWNKKSLKLKSPWWESPAPPSIMKKRGTAEQVNSYGKTYYRYFADTGQLVYEQRRKHSRHPFKAALVQPFLQYVTEQIKASPVPGCSSRKSDPKQAVSSRRLD